MRELPITFDDAMVRSLLSGQKTQTRRIISPQPTAHRGLAACEGDLAWELSPGAYIISNKPYAPEDFVKRRGRYGEAGDRLWVREAWSLDGADAARPVVYRATFEKDFWVVPGDDRPLWNAPKSMLRESSRLLLEVISIRTEKLQDISEADCLAEGAPGGHGVIPGYMYAATPFEHYHHIWASIYGESSWKANPWVWVVEFKIVTE